MGQVISATPRPVYPDDEWAETYANRVPRISKDQVLIEYTAHPDASFHLWDGLVVPLADVEAGWYFRREGPGLLIGMGMQESDEEDPQVNWSFLDTVVEHNFDLFARHEV